MKNWQWVKPYSYRAYYELVISKRSGVARVNEGSHSFTCHPHIYTQVEPGIERVQALAYISRSPYVVVAIANPPNTAQLGAPPTILQVTSGSVQ